MVLARLCAQMVEAGSCQPGVTTKLGLVAGKIYGNDEDRISEHFAKQDWLFRGPDWLKSELKKAGTSEYENLISSVTAKLLQ